MKFLLAAFVGLSTIQASHVLAGTQAEYLALQQWCIGRNKWQAEGVNTPYPNPPEYFHFHHYCFAMPAMYRLYSTSDKSKQRNEVSEVVNQTNYVISHVPEAHFLMPEVYALRGKALALGGQNAQAEASLLKSLQLDPGHVGARIALANFYLDTNRKAKAVEVVKVGLEMDSQNTKLRQLASRLGMKIEEAKPAVTPDPSAGATSDDGGSESETSPPSTSATEGSVPSHETTKSSQQSNAVGGELPPAVPAEQLKIGTPKNPYCRFCPD